VVKLGSKLKKGNGIFWWGGAGWLWPSLCRDWLVVIPNVDAALFVKVVVASTYAATSKSPMSLSGFSQTLFGKAQSLMPRDQRLGFDALAAS
jgi:hypothetical protein